MVVNSGDHHNHEGRRCFDPTAESSFRDGFQPRVSANSDREWQYLSNSPNLHGSRFLKVTSFDFVRMVPLCYYLRPLVSCQQIRDEACVKSASALCNLGGGKVRVLVFAAQATHVPFLADRSSTVSLASYEPACTFSRPRTRDSSISSQRATTADRSNTAQV